MKVHFGEFVLIPVLNISHFAFHCYNRGYINSETRLMVPLVCHFTCCTLWTGRWRGNTVRFTCSEFTSQWPIHKWSPYFSHCVMYIVIKKYAGCKPLETGTWSVKVWGRYFMFTYMAQWFICLAHTHLLVGSCCSKIGIQKYRNLCHSCSMVLA